MPSVVGSGAVPRCASGPLPGAAGAGFWSIDTRGAEPDSDPVTGSAGEGIGAAGGGGADALASPEGRDAVSLGAEAVGTPDGVAGPGGSRRSEAADVPRDRGVSGMGRGPGVLPGRVALSGELAGLRNDEIGDRGTGAGLAGATLGCRGGSGVNGRGVTGRGGADCWLPSAGAGGWGELGGGWSVRFTASLWTSSRSRTGADSTWASSPAGDTVGGSGEAGVPPCPLRPDVGEGTGPAWTGEPSAGMGDSGELVPASLSRDWGIETLG